MEEGQTEMSQVLSLLQQLRQQVTDQQSQITQMQAVQTRVRGESELSGMVPTSQLIQDLRNQTTAGSSSTNPTMTIDTRSIGKPDSFKGDPKEYADWSLFLRLTCHASQQDTSSCLRELKVLGFQCPTD